MHSQQQQQQQQPPPPQSLMQSQHHNHHHHHHQPQHQQQQQSLPQQHQHHHQQQHQQPHQQQHQHQTPIQSQQQHSHGPHSEQPHYYPQSQHPPHMNHSHGQHHVNPQAQQAHPQHRQQHQQHPQPHHQQSHHHNHHHMQPTQHHMSTHGMPQMIPYGQNIIYPPQAMGHHAFPAPSHVSQPTFNHAPAPNHRSEPINVNSQPQTQPQPQAQPISQTPTQPQPQTQQPQPSIQHQQSQPQHPPAQHPQPPQPPGVINQNTMTHMRQMTAPIMGNTGIHQISNGPILDTHMQNRMPITGWSHYLPGPYNMAHIVPFPVHNYTGAHMTAPNPAMMNPRLPMDMGIRPTYDLQNNTATTPAKVPTSQATPIMVAKPPTTIPPVPGVVQHPPAVVVPIKPRERRRLDIVDPKTKHVFTDDELKGSTTSNPSSSTTDTTVTTTATTSTTTSAPIANTPVQLSASKGNDAISGDQQKAPEVKSSDNTAENAPQPVKTSTQPATSPEDHAQHLTRNVTPTSSSIIRSKSPILQTKLVAMNEHTTTSDAKENLASVIIDSMQALSVSSSSNGASSVTASKLASTMQTSPDQTKPLKSDVVDNATTPRADKGDTKQENLKLIGDKENHVSSEKAETPEKKLNPDFPYSEGQYSPLNPTGHRRYTMGFLKAVGKHLGFDDREVFHSDPMAPNFMQHQEFSSHNYGIPRRNSQQTLNNKPPVRRIIATQSMQPEISLKTAEKPWKPELGAEKIKAVETGEIDTQRLLKLFRGLLNKITPQKYDSIIEKIEALNLEGDDRLKSVIDLVFDKAVDEPSFCELYARMSKVIAARNSQFNHHLLKKCQDEFETNDLYVGLNVETRELDIEVETDLAKKKLLEEELYEDMRLRRTKYLGTIKLIGEMYKLDLLVPKIIGFCIARLLSDISNENLECLCSLLTTVGAKLAGEEEEIRKTLKNTLSVLIDIVNNKKTNEVLILESRIRFKILDTIDLSKKNWKPRMVENNPKKLSEIHEENNKQRPFQSSRNNNMKANEPNNRPQNNRLHQPFPPRR